MNKTDLSPLNVGVVYQKSSEQYTVRIQDQWVNCRLSSALLDQQSTHSKRKSERISELVVVGDSVRLVFDANGSGQIVEILPRQNQLSRRGAKPKPDSFALEQVIVANVDQVVAVFAITQPDLKWNMLDRYLITAEASRLPVLVCLTKLDLVDSLAPEARESYEQGLVEYQSLGYTILTTSTLDGTGLTQLQQAFAGRVSVLLGKSGVGKTSLLNALQPGLERRVSEVSQKLAKGRHTTTSLEMIPLEGGGALIDTPGMREFGLWDIPPDDLAWFFPEMRPWLGLCRFRLDCQHNEEPGCAVRKAVMAGAISPRRYQNYMKLFEELRDQH
jgi:ribosome biogenesis GTPase / thiamine phosphate phosphatase